MNNLSDQESQPLLIPSVFDSPPEDLGLAQAVWIEETAQHSLEVFSISFIPINKDRGPKKEPGFGTRDLGSYPNSGPSTPL